MRMAKTTRMRKMPTGNLDLVRDRVQLEARAEIEGTSGRIGERIFPLQELYVLRRIRQCNGPERAAETPPADAGNIPRILVCRE